MQNEKTLEEYKIKEVPKAYVIESPIKELNDRAFRSLASARRAVAQRMNTPVFYEELSGQLAPIGRKSGAGRPRGSKNRQRA